MGTDRPIVQFMVVEDDPQLRNSMERIIGRYARERAIEAHVFLVSRSSEAKEILETEKIDVMIADFRLDDGPTGMDLREFCSTKFPELPFILMSGVPEEVFEALLQRGGGCGIYLSKPFEASTCHEAIDEVLTHRFGVLVKAKAS